MKASHKNKNALADSAGQTDDGTVSGLRGFLRALTDPTHSVDSSQAGRLRAEMIASVIAITPNLMLANIVGSVLCALVFWDTPAATGVCIWAACLSVFAAFGFHFARVSSRRQRPAEVSHRAQYRLMINAASAGLFWSMLFVIAYSADDLHRQLVLCCIMLGAITLGLFGMLAVPPAAATYALAIVAPCAIKLLTSNNPQALDLMIMLAVFIVFSLTSLLWYQRFFVDRFIRAEEVRRQNELIGILLRDFEANVSDWLWETDANGKLQLSANGFAKMTDLDAEDISGKDFLAFIGSMQGTAFMAGRPENPITLLQLAFTMRAPFNGIEIPVMMSGLTRWWSLTGKPVTDSTGKFIGYRGVGSDVTQRRQSQDKVSYMAHYDPLTELPNRAFFHHTLNGQIERVEKGSSSGFGVMFIDLDEFKAVNDVLGHSAGDRLLVVVGNRLRTALPSQMMLARLGGDEFAVIAPDETDIDRLSTIANTLIRAVREPVTLDHNTVNVGASVGIAVAPQHGLGSADLLRRADLALYRAKAQGRSKVSLFEPSVEAEFQKRRAMEDALRFAIARNELEVYYQPIVDLETNRVVSAEALLRWRHPRQGFISPAEFIPIAEASGLIVQIGEWVLRRACEDAMAWPKDVRVSVNLSPVQFKNARLPATIVGALAASHLPGSRLELEITESVLMNETEAAAIIEQLRVLGAHLALDDFGVGYSSLSYLRKFPFDKIKIDQSFVHDARNNPINYGIIETIAGLGGKLNMAITVEGIEDERDVDNVRAAGCHYAQGYLFGRPMPKDALMELLAVRNAPSIPELDSKAG